MYMFWEDCKQTLLYSSCCLVETYICRITFSLVQDSLYDLFFYVCIENLHDFVSLIFNTVYDIEATWCMHACIG